MRMTKAEAIQEFRQVVQIERGDTIARREAWNDYTDMLCKDRLITSYQYENWSNPF